MLSDTMTQPTQVNPTPIILSVVMDIPAGTAPSRKLMSGQAARIMTGAPIPDGATAIVPVEETNDNWQKGDSPLTTQNCRHFESSK